METKSAVMGAAGSLLVVGLAFGFVATANAENAPEPVITTTTSVAPTATPTQEPSVSAPAPEPTVSTPAAPVAAPVPADTTPAAINPAPAVTEPATVAPVDVPAAPIEAQPVQTYMPGVTVSGSGDGQVNAPADPNDIKNINRVPMPAPTP